MNEFDEKPIALNSVYRIVWTNPPTIEDFLTDADWGDAEELLSWVADLESVTPRNEDD